MVNTIWKEVFLIMCSCLKENARHSGRFLLSLRITNDYALQILCGEQHNIWNEEGKLDGLPLNRALRDDDGKIYDVVAGSFLVVGLTEENFGSLTPEQLAAFEEKFHSPEVFVRMGRGIMAIPVDEKAAEAAAPEMKPQKHVKEEAR